MRVSELTAWLASQRRDAPVLIDRDGDISTACLELPDHEIYLYVVPDDGRSSQTVGGFLDRLQHMPPALEVLTLSDGTWRSAGPSLVQAGEDLYDLAEASVIF